MHFLDAETRRELGFEAIWLRIRPVSPLGRALQREARAFLPEQKAELEDAWHRLEQAVHCLRRQPAAGEGLLHSLSQLKDISGIIARSARGETLDDVELYEVKKLLHLAEEVQGELHRLGWAPLLPVPLDVCTPCREDLSVGQGGELSFYLADAYDELLAAARRRRRFLEERLAELRSRVDAQVWAAVGRGLSSEDEITVSSRDQSALAELEKVPDLVRIQETEGFVTFRWVDRGEGAQLRGELAAVRSQEEERKAAVRAELSRVVGAHAPRLLRILEILGFLDFLLAKARFCLEMQGVKPSLAGEECLVIRGGRHLLVEEEVRQAGGVYCPLSLELRPGVTVITGPNMGGKTVTLKTIGLLVAMAQYGLLVPAQSMTFKPRRFLRAHLPSSQGMPGLSRFAREVFFVREVLPYSGEPGLILLDELAQSTSPGEGAAVAQAVVERLRAAPAMTVLATHYSCLTQIEGVVHYRVRGLDKEQLQKEVLPLSAWNLEALQRFMDYTLEQAAPGDVGPSDAVFVAEALGVEPGVIARAKALQRSEDGGQ